jgi:hypothetical protein
LTYASRFSWEAGQFEQGLKNSKHNKVIENGQRRNKDPKFVVFKLLAGHKKFASVRGSFLLPAFKVLLIAVALLLFA